VVGEHAVALALATGRKAFYTAPIKALSNQKFNDLRAVLGDDRVGLLTGDHSINGDAAVVVMTTEVLRNMVYAGSAALRDLGFVVLDEVHFLQDTYRGPVWEEVLIHTPPEVTFVCLSATVSNAVELGDWIAELRGPTDTVVEHERPIRLDSLYFVGDRSSERDHLVPLLIDGRPNPEGHRFDADQTRERGARPHPRRRRFFTPRRLETIERLGSERLLPAIYFIFSRAGCDDAAMACLDAGLRLTDGPERTRIREIAETRTAALSDSDLDVLGWDRWISALEMGIAAHHAGMIPAFRETVEECFNQGLVRAVFATETLALGINMPARSVAIERLTKFNGETHENLTPGQFTQLTGRAGRRGIDVSGSAVVLWSPFVTFSQVAALAASREFPLVSAFRPTYNMASNLVHRYDRTVAHQILGRSFAQFQADRASVQLRRRADGLVAELAGLDDESVAVAVFDVGGYSDLADTVRALKRSRPDRRDAIEASLAALRPGDVVERRSDRGRRALLVLSVAHRGAGAIRVRAVTAQGQQVSLQTSNVREPVESIARVDLPVPFLPQDPRYRKEAASLLRRVNMSRARSRKRSERDRAGRTEGGTLELDEAEARLAAHPLHGHPDRRELLDAHRARVRIATDLAETEALIERRGTSIVRRLDAIIGVLEGYDHVAAPADAEWSLTAAGERLRRIYHECDLLVSIALGDGLFDGLDVPEVASLASCFTYEHRSADPPPPPSLPTPALRAAFSRLESLCDSLNAGERAARIPETRTPEAGFATSAWAWAAGQDLVDVLDEDHTGGDFVRNVKQLIDLLRQLGDVAGESETRRRCRAAADGLLRGVVDAGRDDIEDEIEDDLEDNLIDDEADGTEDENRDDGDDGSRSGVATGPPPSVGGS